MDGVEVMKWVDAAIRSLFLCVVAAGASTPFGCSSAEEDTCPAPESIRVYDSCKVKSSVRCPKWVSGPSNRPVACAACKCDTVSDEPKHWTCSIDANDDACSGIPKP